MRLGIYVAMGCLVASNFASRPADAGLLIPIPDLFGTGMTGTADNSTVLNNGDGELHYFFSGPEAVPHTVDLNGNAVPLSSMNIRVFTQAHPDTATSWSGNSGTSAWIGPDNSDPLLQPAGTYYYTTTFNLTPDLDPSTASIKAYVFGDDGITDVLFNSISTGYQDVVPGTPQSPFQVPFEFDFDSGFLPGENTMVWKVNNSGGATGLRIQIVSSVEQSAFGGGGGPPGDIPEPSSIALALVGLAGLAWGCRRRSQPAAA